MNYLKTLTSTDFIVTPFEVNKSFSFEGTSELTASNVQIDRFLGVNMPPDSGSFLSNPEPLTGEISTEYQRLVYESVKELYYSNYVGVGEKNYLYGSPVATASLVPGVDQLGDRYTGDVSSAARYYNYPQTNLTYKKYFPTGSEEVIGVLSIPSKLYGSHIQPNSFYLSAESGSIKDDGEGNLILNDNPLLMCGNIFYPQGIAIITNGTENTSN